MTPTTERYARRIWVAIAVTSGVMTLVFGGYAGAFAGLVGGVLTAATAAALFAAVHWASTRDTRLPLSEGKHLPRGSAVVVLAVVLVMTLLRETVLTIDVHSSNTSTNTKSSHQSVNGARPPRGVSLGPASDGVRTGFFRACRCTEDETGGYAVRVEGPSMCWAPLVKPVDAVLQAEASGGGSHFKLDITTSGTILGFVSTRACERMIGESLGKSFAERNAKWAR